MPRSRRGASRFLICHSTTTVLASDTPPSVDVLLLSIPQRNQQTGSTSNDVHSEFLSLPSGRLTLRAWLHLYMLDAQVAGLLDDLLRHVWRRDDRNTVYIFGQ